MLKKYCMKGPHLNAACAAYRCKHILMQIPVLHKPMKAARESVVTTRDDSVEGMISSEVMYAGTTARQYIVRFPSKAAKIICAANTTAKSCDIDICVSWER